ncbi:MAG: hypothetical protein IJ593_11855 [Lachnospiraceae bacterium]|nr:hypothetical protein [Lachnospiraceae bacterium]
MNKKRTIIVLLIILVCVILIILFSINKYKKYKGSSKRYVEEIMKTSVESINIDSEIDHASVGLVLRLAIEGDCDWDTLKLSDNFKTKFKNGKNIISNRDDYQSFSSGYDYDFGFFKDYTIWLCGDKFDNIFNILKYGDAVSTEFYFEYKVDENNLLDDVKLIRKKDVFSINGERVDGKKEVGYDNLPNYIHKLSNPTNKDIREYFSDVPFAKKYQVINKPDIEKLGEPKESECRIDGEKITLIFDFGTYKKVWDVKYNIDTDFQLDYIEFVEI